MAKLGRLIPYVFTVTGRDYTIWSKPGELDQFIGGLVEATDAGPVNTITVVRGHTRKQYPNDPTPVTVASHQRRRLKTAAIRRQTLPGRNVYFEFEVTSGGPVKTVVVTATTDAPFIDLHAYCIANSVDDFVLRSPNGRPHDIVRVGGLKQPAPPPPVDVVV